MKKNDLLKAIGIMFLVFIIFSWIVPTGYFNNGEYVSNSTIPVGLFDIIIYPLITITSSVFILTALVFICIGIFYGVLNKTNSYSKLLDTLAKKFKGREKTVLALVIIITTVLSSITGLSLPLFVFVPFLSTLLILLGYSKISAMEATVGSILVGNLASTYGFNVAGYITYLTGSINNLIWYRLALLLLSIIILVIFILKTASFEKTKDITFYSKTNKKVSIKSTTICLVITFLITFISMFNWEGVFKITLFNDIYNSIIGVKILDYPIFSKLLGSVTAFGTWNNYNLCLILIIMSFIIGKLYKLSIKDILDGAFDGIKEMLPTAIMVVIANTIFLLVNTNSNGYTFYNTMVNSTLGNKIAILPFSITTLIGSFIYNDFPYLLSTLYNAIIIHNDQFNIIGMISQTMHGLVQLIAPTSIILVAGLTYFKIPYFNWLKNIWRLLLCLFVLSVIFLIII